MANFWEQVGDYALGVVNDIIHTVEEKTYQSPLEMTGIAMREAMKPVRYYGKQYPYATPIKTDFIRVNGSYVAASGWRPATYELKTDIHDKEFSAIMSQFELQEGQSLNHSITNVGESDGIVDKSYGRNSNYNATTGDIINVNQLGNGESLA